MDKKLLVRRIILPVCKTCGKVAEYEILSDSDGKRQTFALCKKHGKKYLDERNVQFIVERDMRINLPNRIENFKTSSIAMTGGKFAWENWKDFGSQEKNRKEKFTIPIEVIVADLLPDDYILEDKMVKFSSGGDSHNFGVPKDSMVRDLKILWEGKIIRYQIYEHKLLKKEVIG